MESIKSNGTPRAFISSCYEKPEKQVVSLVPDPNINFFNGKLDPYKNQIKNVTFKPVNNPTLKEITESISKITYDSFKRETQRKK
jgi:hypothetical protein